MSYITSYLIDISKDEVIERLKNPKEVAVDAVNRFKIGNFIISNQEQGLVSGKISVYRLYDDYEFDLNENLEIERSKKDSFLYDEVLFTIFPDIKVISFSSKPNAQLFGMDILSKVLFDDGGKIYGITFEPQKVYEAKKQGKFSNVWHNGVKYDGNIGYVGQYGTEIDEDTMFDDNPTKRTGLGIEFSSATGKIIKVAVYKEGSLLRHTKLRDTIEDLKLEKEIVKCFLEYSNYGRVVPQTNADRFLSLEDFF